LAAVSNTGSYRYKIKVINGQVTHYSFLVIYFSSPELLSQLTIIGRDFFQSGALTEISFPVQEVLHPISGFLLLAQQDGQPGLNSSNGGSWK
jgi:hypothetical protein